MHPFEDLEIPDGHVGIHWFGQSTFGLKHPDGTILQVDPYYPRERPADKFIRTRAPLMEEALRTNWVLLTHDHGDHTCMESIDRIRSSYAHVKFVGPSESCARMRDGGISDASITQVTAGDNVLTIVEGWESLGHLENHLVAEHMVAYRPRVREMIRQSKLQILQSC